MITATLFLVFAVITILGMPIALALVGGGVGAWLGMELFRHKTQHQIGRAHV